jgi:PAS domain S-box-containing protein
MTFNSMQTWSFDTPLIPNLFGLQHLLLAYKLEITLSIFLALILVTVVLFVQDREYRKTINFRLSTNSKKENIAHREKLLAKIPVVRVVFIIGLVALFIFVLFSYQHYENQAYTMFFATGIFVLNVLGSYFFGRLKRTQETEHLVNNLHIHIKSTEEAQKNLVQSEKRMQQQSTSLASLATMQLNKSPSPKVFLRQLIRQSAETLNADRVSVWLYSKDNNLLECEALYELKTQTYSHGGQLKASDLPIYFTAMAGSRVLAIDDARNNQVTQEFAADYLPENNIGAMLDATIWQENEMLGVLCHEHVGEMRHWRLDEENYVGSLADLARLAFELDKRHKVETDLIEHQESFETRVQHRTAIIESNAKLFRFLVERAPVIILYMNANNEILEMNPEAERVTGYSREYVIGKTYQSLFVPEYVEEEHDLYFCDVTRGRPVQGRDMKMRRADGVTIDISVSRSMEFDTEGNAVIISIGQDISQKKALEDSLIMAREAAESADRIKSMFIASMSHELRTPLNSIIGFISVVLQGMSGEVNAKQSDQLNRAYFSAKHLLSLISDVIDISKIEAGYLETDEEQVGIAELLNEVYYTVEHLVKEKSLAFTIECQEDLAIFTDRKRLFQVIINVVSNALKYTEKGYVHVVVKTELDNVFIEIEDTGVGIDEAGLAKLFKPFERIDSHLKIKTPGTGLGLYLTDSILRVLLGGDITVKSMLGEGSTFTIMLPYSIPEVKAVQMTSILE